MNAGAGLFEQLLPTVRRAERERFVFFFGLSALLSLAQTLGLAGSEAIFLSALGTEQLPQTFLMASVVTIAASLVYASVVGRVRNDRLFTGMLAAAAVLLGIGWWALPLDLPLLYMVLFSTFYVCQTVFVCLHYWTFAADFFDTLSSKRVFPLFAVGGSVGGAAGGAAAVVLSSIGSPRDLIAGWAVVLLAAAVVIHLGRERLLRWAPVGMRELDESSMTGLQGALRFARRSALARWLLASVVGMIFSLFLIQYVYMDIFARSFSSAKAMATFFGAYLAITNLIELAIGRLVTPWLIERLGVAQANLLHPMLTLATFGLLAIDPRLHAAVMARMTRELLENALAGPIRALSYNALAERFRGRMRALLEGTVPYAGMFIAGTTLLVIGGDVSLPWLCAVGAVSALLYVAANLRVRREYLRSLVEDLGAGRLELEDVRAQLGPAELDGIAEQWEELLAEEGRHPTSAVLQLAPLLAAGGLLAPLRRTALHALPRVRVISLDALAAAQDEQIAELAAAALDDESAAVRLAGTRAAADLPQCPEPLRTRLTERLDDEDPDVRAEAARCLGDVGRVTLLAMAADTRAEVAISALERLPAPLLQAATDRLDDPAPRVRAAAMRCVARIGPAGSLTTADLIRELRHSDAAVRHAAAHTLRHRSDAIAAEALAEALDDVARPVRDEAGLALASLGAAGLSAARPILAGSRTWTVDAALSAVANMGDSAARELLLSAYRERVLEAWRSSIAVDALVAGDNLVSRFLAAALEDASLRSRFLAFRILELVEDPIVVRSVTRALQRGRGALRANALEVLTHLGERDSSQLLATLLEDGAVAEKLSAVAHRIAPPTGWDEVLRTAEASSDRWLRLAASGAGVTGADGAELEEVKTMERLLALRHVPLFSGLSLEQLEAIQRFMREVQYVTGEIVVREGDPGDELFVLLEGEVEVVKAHGTAEQVVLNTMRPITYMGEIAILDSSPRSATIVVTQDARMLSLEGERFKELIRQAPEIAFEIFPVLTARIRAAEEPR